MPKLRLAILSAFALLAPLSMSPVVHAQDTPSFDILGISLGMPLDDAVAIVNGHTPEMRVTVSEGDIGAIRGARIRGLKYPLGVDGERACVGARCGTYGNEALGAYAVAPPNESVVGAVYRWITFQQVPVQALLGALFEKYGEPLFAALPEQRNAMYTLSWSRNPDGEPVKDRAAVESCARENRQMDVKRVAVTAMFHTDEVQSPLENCGFTLVVMVMSNNPDMTQALANGYHIIMYDGNELRRRNSATLDFTVAEAEKLEAEQMQRAQDTQMPQL